VGRGDRPAPAAGADQCYAQGKPSDSTGDAQAPVAEPRKSNRRLHDLFADYFRYERANAAARRFISKSTVMAISRRDVVEFLQRRRDPLPAIQIEECAEEALQRFLRLRRKHYRGYRRGDEGTP
jgi:hypothetical protein